MTPMKKTVPERSLRDALERAQAQLKVAEQKIALMEAAAQEHARQADVRLKTNLGPVEKQLQKARAQFEQLQRESQATLESVRASWIREVTLRETEIARLQKLLNESRAIEDPAARCPRCGSTERLRNARISVNADSAEVTVSRPKAGLFDLPIYRSFTSVEVCRRCGRIEILATDLAALQKADASANK